MIGILIISHGKMAEGMKDSLNLIMGDIDNLDTASLNVGEDFENFKSVIEKKIIALDQGKGVLVFVDIFGASPYNAYMYSIQELNIRGIKSKVITGVNLPMIIQSITMRESLDLIELHQTAIDSGKEGIQDMPDLMIDKQDEEDY